jgi:hypothetical protein
MRTEKPPFRLPVYQTVFCASAVCLFLGADIASRVVHAAPPAEPPKTVTAQEFRLVDKTGAERAALALQPDGSPYLSLTDKTNARRITMRVRPDGGTVFAINDPDGKNRLAMETGADGSASMTVTANKGKAGAGFLMSGDGSPMLIVRDKEGSVAFMEPAPDVLEDPDKKPGEGAAPGKKQSTGK